MSEKRGDGGVSRNGLSLIGNAPASDDDARYDAVLGASVIIVLMLHYVSSQLLTIDSTRLGSIDSTQLNTSARRN